MTAGANVEFRASDTTTLTYWDDVNKRFGVGTATPETPFHAFGTTFPVGLIERQVTNTNSGGSAFGIRTTSTGNMTDGFGTGFTFQIEDNAGTANPIANIFASRNGADNTGKLVLNVYNAGSVVEALTVLNDGKVGIGTSSSIRSKFEVLGAGSNTVGISTSIIGLQSTANAAHQWGMRLGATSGELNLDSNFGGVDVNIVKFERGGNVGIGVSTVSAKLHVGGNTIISDSGTLLVGAVGSNLSVLSTTPRIQAITTSGIAISSVGVGDGTNNNRLGIYVDHTNREQGIAFTRSTGAIPFFIKDVSTNRFLIDVNGNVGIGTGSATTAVRRLQINSDTDASLYIRRNTTTTGDYAEVLFQTSTADLYATGIRSQRVASGFSDILFMGQQTAGSVYATLYEMGRFTATGNFGLGTGATVSAKLHVVSTTEQLRLGYDASNYASFTVASTGLLTIAPTGNADVKIGGTSDLIPAGHLTGGSLGIAGAYWKDVLAQRLQIYNNGTNTFNMDGAGSWTVGATRLTVASGGNVGIGTATPSAKLDVSSTTQGFLPPRMTTTQKNAISSPATGLVVYDTTLNKLCVYTGAGWETITSA